MSNNKKSHAGKGMSPRQGYNPENWYANYDAIFGKRTKQNKSKNTNHQSSGSNK
jgi:hypothetical protein